MFNTCFREYIILDKFKLLIENGAVLILKIKWAKNKEIKEILKKAK